MADEDDKSAPSLEPPSLFGRSKRKQKAVPAAPEAELTTILEADPEPAAEPAAPAGGEPDTVPATETVPSSPPSAVEPEPVAEPAAPGGGDPDTVPATKTVPSSPPAAAEPEPLATGELEPKPPREPWLTGWLAAAVTGLFVGLVIVAATSGGEEICTRAKGTSSCGDSGFFLLIAVLVVGVLVGAALLRAAQVPDPGSTSFLAVGLLSIVTLLFLVGEIFQWWMIIAIPLVAIATYVLSHYVTTTYIEPTEDPASAPKEQEPHDIR